MERRTIIKDKSSVQLKEEVKELNNQYCSLKKAYNSKLLEIDELNSKLSKLNQFSVKVSDISTLFNLEEIVSKMIKEITGAKFTVFSEYSTDQRTLYVQHIELEPGLIGKVINLLGAQIKKMDIPVSEEIYHMMATEIIGVRETLYEASFGKVPLTVSASIQKLLNVDRFIGIAYLIDGKLYGTSLLGMGKGVPDPPKQILENILYLVGIALRRRKSENALVESKRQITAMLEAIPDLMFLQDKDGVYIDYHAPKDSILYVPSDTFIGKNMKEILPKEIASEFYEIFENALKTRTVQNYEYALMLPNGKAYFESKTIAYEGDKVLSIVRDITGRKEAELKAQLQNQELRRLNEDKDRFMSILAHDLKSPFNSILGLLDLVCENICHYEIGKISKLLSTIRRASRQYYQLIESLLFWAKSKSGKMVINFEKINLATLCKQIIEELKPNADLKQIRIYSLVGEEDTAMADSEMIKTILRNLITNAIKFTGIDGQVSVYTENGTENLIVVISDTGIGIAEENLDLLFNLSSFQTTKGTAGETGTGLGLFLCKELIERNNGEIWVESKPGMGSKFKFTLPRAI